MSKKSIDLISQHTPFLFFFFGKRFIYFYFLCMCVLLAQMSVHPCIITHEGQTRASDSLELELQMVESHRVGAGNQSWDLWENHKAS